MTVSQLEQLISDQRLPENFMQTVDRWYHPIAEEIARLAINKGDTLVIGVQGCQGSGKSTLSAFLKCLLESRHQLTTAVLSIDDFYLTKAERVALSESVHPLLATRGVPGTHDIELANHCLDALCALAQGQRHKIPRFDKAEDDRADVCDWEPIAGPVNIIILEGWCVGLAPQENEVLSSPKNTLEKEEDGDGIWRSYVNIRLANDYQSLFKRLDRLVVLKAPSFDCVFQWRLRQEKKLMAKLSAENKTGNAVMSEDGITRFISHYQRLTEHALDTLPKKADWLLSLAEDQQIFNLTTQPSQQESTVG